MAHIAVVDANNIVINVITTGSEPLMSDENGNEVDEIINHQMNTLPLYIGKRLLRTSYNTIANEHKNGGTPYRKNYATIGGTYDEQRDAFIPPKPPAVPSWILDEETCRWKAPVAVPTDGKRYRWNESIVNWEAF